MSHSKSRQQAETAFSNLQSQFFAKARAVDEADFVVQEREEKTLRLRQARLASEESALAAALAASAAKPAKKS